MIRFITSIFRGPCSKLTCRGLGVEKSSPLFKCNALESDKLTTNEMNKINVKNVEKIWSRITFLIHVNILCHFMFYFVYHANFFKSKLTALNANIFINCNYKMTYLKIFHKCAISRGKQTKKVINCCWEHLTVRMFLKNKNKYRNFIFILYGNKWNDSIWTIIDNRNLEAWSKIA